jgi:hypothetical protein
MILSPLHPSVTAILQASDVAGSIWRQLESSDRAVAGHDAPGSFLARHVPYCARPGTEYPVTKSRVRQRLWQDRGSWMASIP